MSIQSILDEQALNVVRIDVNNYRRLNDGHPTWVGIMNNEAVNRFTSSPIPFDAMNESQQKKFKTEFKKWVEFKVRHHGGGIDGYACTNGIMVTDSRIKQPKVLKIFFEKLENNIVIATVENAETGSVVKEFGKHYMTRVALSDMPEDPYDGMVFNRAAFALFGIEI